MSEGKPIYDCVKLSDDMGKHHGKEQEVTLCVKELNL
jgi:hypothetical protein